MSERREATGGRKGKSQTCKVPKKRKGKECNENEMKTNTDSHPHYQSRDVTGINDENKRKRKGTRRKGRRKGGKHTIENK